MGKIKDIKRDAEGWAANSISSESEAERLLNQIKRLADGVISNAPHSAEAYDPEGQTLCVNEGWKRLWGMEPVVVKDYNILQDENLHTKCTWEAVRGGFEGNAGPTPPALFSPEEIGFPGRLRWTDGFIYPLYNSDDEIARVVLLLRDLTDSKMALSEIREIRNQLQELHFKYEAVSDRLEQLTSPRTTRLEGLPDEAELRKSITYLSKREKQVFTMLAQDKSAKEIAYQLKLASKSVYTYRSRLMQKLGLHTNVQLAAAYVELKDLLK